MFGLAQLSRFSLVLLLFFFSLSFTIFFIALLSVSGCVSNITFKCQCVYVYIHVCACSTGPFILRGGSHDSTADPGDNACWVTNGCKGGSEADCDWRLDVRDIIVHVFHVC